MRKVGHATCLCLLGTMLLAGCEDDSWHGHHKRLLVEAQKAATGRKGCLNREDQAAVNLWESRQIDILTSLVNERNPIFTEDDFFRWRRARLKAMVAGVNADSAFARCISAKHPKKEI